MSPLRPRLGMVALLGAALLAQTAFFPYVRVAGVVPDVMVLAVVAVAVREGAEVGAVFGFAAGVLIDLLLEVPVGLSAIAYVIVGYGMGLFHAGFLRVRWWLGALLGGAGSLAAGTIFVVVGVILGLDHLLALRTAFIIPARALYDAALALLVFPLAAKLVGPTEEELVPYRG